MSLDTFATKLYQEHNRARLGHLASLGLNLSNKRVLEVGSGPGDHTGFYLLQDNTVVATDARKECIELLRARYPRVIARVEDMNLPLIEDLGLFDIVHCYGLLYHLEQPEAAIEAMAKACRGLLLLETCVSMGEGEAINLVPEPDDFTQASTGTGCRPTRLWVFNTLAARFPFVYQTRTQPNHPEFPLDWAAPAPALLTRAVFVASRAPLDERVFSSVLLDKQTRGHGI